MAFVKKTVAKKPASYTKTAKAPVKGAANYARKKAEEAEAEIEEVVDEVEEVEDVETGGEDVQDDYEPTESPRRENPRGPVFNQRGQGGSGARPAQGREPGKALRLTGLFAGKRDGCFSGKLRDEDASNLAALIQEAQSAGQQIVFFLWENNGNPQFSLTANISAPAQKKSWGNKGGGGWDRGGQGQGNFGGQNRGFRRY